MTASTRIQSATNCLAKTWLVCYLRFENGSEYHNYVERVTDKIVYTIEGNTSSADGVVDNGAALCMAGKRGLA